jgi:hypothetical protein
MQTTFRLLKLLVATHNRKVQAELDATIDAIHATHVRSLPHAVSVAVSGTRPGARTQRLQPAVPARARAWLRTAGLHAPRRAVVQCSGCVSAVGPTGRWTSGRVGSGQRACSALLCSAPQASQLDDLAQLRIQSDLARQQIIVDDEETAALRLCTHFLDARASAAAEYESP